MNLVDRSKKDQCRLIEGKVKNVCGFSKPFYDIVTIDELWTHAYEIESKQ